MAALTVASYASPIAAAQLLSVDEQVTPDGTPTLQVMLPAALLLAGAPPLLLPLAGAPLSPPPQITARSVIWMLCILVLLSFAREYAVPASAIPPPPLRVDGWSERVAPHHWRPAVRVAHWRLGTVGHHDACDRQAIHDAWSARSRSIPRWLVASVQHQQRGFAVERAGEQDAVFLAAGQRW